MSQSHESVSANVASGGHEGEQANQDGEQAYQWNPRVACRTLEGTAFILLNSKMVSLNEVGTVVWDLCENGATLKRVANEIVDQFDVTEDDALADARQFVQELLDREMLLAARPEVGSGR